jgi:hypothetical protein
MYVLIENAQIKSYPYTVGQLRKDNPNTSFPKNIPADTLAAYGVYSVGYEAAPEYDPATHRLEHSNVPVLKDGSWVLTKTVVALTAEQIADREAASAKAVRTKRDGLLAETDWMALTDVTMSAEMTTYRQALRDITTHANFPSLEEADWPVKP